MMHDCSTAEFIVNCTVNVQDMCQKEVLVKDDGKANLWFTAYFTSPPVENMFYLSAVACFRAQQRQFG